MFYTFHYKGGCYIHVSEISGQMAYEWQDESGNIHIARSVHAAKCAITHHVKRMETEHENHHQ